MLTSEDKSHKTLIINAWTCSKFSARKLIEVPNKN